MKNIVSVAMAFFSLALMQINAQAIQGTSSSSSDIRFGGKVGLNMATLGGTTRFGTYSTKPGIHVGAVVEIPFTDKILIQPEILLSLQGSGGYITNENLNLWYATIPVMAKYNVWDALYIEAGPQIGFLFAENTNEAYLNDALQIQEGPNLDTNTIDIGLGFGAGYELNDNFYFQARFNFGIVNAIQDVNSKNRVLQLSAIYFL